MTLLLLLLAGWLALSVLLALSAGEPAPGVVHRVETADGWSLRVHRFEPPPGVPRRPVPVVLGHGITMSARCWYLSERAHIPRLLAAAGHDVWVAEYRGVIGSRAPSWRARFAFDCETLAQFDLPAIIDGVCRLTGSDRVSWVGHSMGGLLVYLYAGQFGSDRLHRVVTLGSPTRFGPKPFPALLPGLVGAADRIPILPSWPATVLSLPAASLCPQLGPATVFRPAHWSFAERAALLAWAYTDVPTRLQAWFGRMKMKRASVCPDDPADPGPLPGGFRKLVAPLLVVASTGDRLVLPRSSRAAFDRAASPRKLWRLFGDPTQPAGPWFGHNDLICSAAAVQSVYPLVREWLEREEPDLDELTAAVARGLL